MIFIMMFSSFSSSTNIISSMISMILFLGVTGSIGISVGGFVNGGGKGSGGGGIGV